jgi:hypothetical protein
MHGRLAADSDTDERRLEGERDERADREAEALAVGINRQDGNPKREAA